MLGWLLRRRKRPLSDHERVCLQAFREMTIRDVRARADEFEQAEAQFVQWLATRRQQRSHAPDGFEQRGYAPEVQYGHPGREWRKLESELRGRGLWAVGELEEREQVRWARRLNALSDALARPNQRWIGPPLATPQIREHEAP